MQGGEQQLQVQQQQLQGQQEQLQGHVAYGDLDGHLEQTMPVVMENGARAPHSWVSTTSVSNNHTGPGMSVTLTTMMVPPSSGLGLCVINSSGV